MSARARAGRGSPPVAFKAPIRCSRPSITCERACQNQVLAMSTGRPLKRVPEDEIRRTVAEFATYEKQAELHFGALRRILDREEPEYAD